MVSAALQTLVSNSSRDVIRPRGLLRTSARSLLKGARVYTTAKSHRSPSYSRLQVGKALVEVVLGVLVVGVLLELDLGGGDDERRQAHLALDALRGGVILELAACGAGNGKSGVRIAAANVNESGGRSGKVAYPCPPCPSFPAPSCEPSRFSERCLRPSLLLDQLSVQVLWIMAGVPASVSIFRDAYGN